VSPYPAVHLDLDGAGFDAIDGGGTDLGQHRRRLAAGFALHNGRKVARPASVAKLGEGKGLAGHRATSIEIGNSLWLDVSRLRGYCLFMLDLSDCAAVERVRDRVSGPFVFKGTRVPVRALFENLEEGATVQEFAEWFPGVSEAQARAVLEYAERSLAAA